MQSDNRCGSRHCAAVQDPANPSGPYVGFVSITAPLARAGADEFQRYRELVLEAAQSLAAARVLPTEIDMVFLTHMHPDHSNALADADGQARFPNATLALHEAELAYWIDDAQVTISEQTGRGVPYFATTRRQMAPYHARMRPFRSGEVFPGLTAVPLPGHTPGHTGYLVASGSESLLIWGDIVHVPELQIPRPEVTIQIDVDPEQAEVARRGILDRVASDRQLVAGMHLHFPGYAHVIQEASGLHRLVPEAWRLDF